MKGKYLRDKNGRFAKKTLPAEEEQLLELKRHKSVLINNSKDIIKLRFAAKLNSEIADALCSELINLKNDIKNLRIPLCKRFWMWLKGERLIYSDEVRKNAK